jgi:ATP-dependent exoDNAse (exonuclease V) beta subunit
MKSSKPFEVVRASAGSGKTYRLVSRYLACCLVHDEPRSFRHVLALTFTNKAAWEMKERILKDLAQVGGGTASEDFVQELLDQTQLTADTLAVRARALRATMLHRYGEMAVMTLDSFTNRLVKSFARDLALDQDYRIELDQDRIVEEAVANVLDRVGEPGHEEFTAMLKGFARLQVEEEKDSRIRHPLTTYGKEVLKEGMRDALGALQDLKPEDFREMSAQLRKDVRREEKTLRALAKLALDKVQAEGLTPKDVSRGSLLTWLNHQSHGEAKAPSPTLSNMFDDGIFTTQKAPTAVVDAVERVRPLAEDVLEQVKRMVPGTPFGRGPYVEEAVDAQNGPCGHACRHF